MVRYNPITGEEMPSYQIHAERLQRVEEIDGGDDDDGAVAGREAAATSSSTMSSDAGSVDQMEGKQVGAISDDGRSTGAGLADTFEDMVAAEMERLRLEYGQDGEAEVEAKKDDDAAAADVASAASTRTIAPLQRSNHHHQKLISPSPSSTKPSPRANHFPSTSILGRDEEKELSTRRQMAREYGAQLRLQMEQDRQTKMSRRKNDGGGLPPASIAPYMVCQKDSTIANTARPSDAVTASGASYGELLRLQMKEDEERRRKQREDNDSALVAKASIDAIGNITDSNAASKDQKAAEYRRQLDEQMAAAKSADHRASKSSGTDIKEIEANQVICKSNQVVTSDEKNKKEMYAHQLREQMNANTARRQRSERTNTPEGSSNASSVALHVPWHLGEDREAQERQRRRDAATEQQRLLELQIQEQNEAKARKKKEEEDDEARDALLLKSRHSAWPSQATDEVAVAPTEEPRRPSDTPGDCPLLAAESTFIPTPKPKIRTKSIEVTEMSQNDAPICPMKSPVIRKGRGGEAFIVSFGDTSERAGNGMGSMASSTDSTNASGALVHSKATKSSPCRRSRSKSKSATASSLRCPPVEPPVTPSERSRDSVLDEDDVLVQDILRSALRRIEVNVPANGEIGGGQEIDSNEKKKKKSVQFRASETASDQSGIPSVPIEKRDAFLPNGSSEYADTLVDPCQVGDQGREFAVPPTSTQKEFEADNFDHKSLLDDHYEELDECCDDDAEGVEEKKLMQALSRIRNSMDTSFAST